MNQIDEFPDYYYDGTNAFKKTDKGFKQITKTLAKKGETSYQFKMVDKFGNRKTLTESKVKSLSGFKLELPKDAIKIDFCKEDYIDKSGNIYNFGFSNPQGIIKKTRISKNGYRVVTITTIENKKRNIEVHQLLAHCFIYPNYVKEGLTVLHLDNNKLNNKLDNLKVGTYSENNKQAYKDGLNIGNLNWRTNKKKY